MTCGIISPRLPRYSESHLGDYKLLFLPRCLQNPQLNWTQVRLQNAIMLESSMYSRSNYCKQDPNQTHSIRSTEGLRAPVTVARLHSLSKN